MTDLHARKTMVEPPRDFLQRGARGGGGLRLGCGGALSWPIFR
jgi:hypothetical protein